MKIAIISGGKAPSEALLKREINGSSIVICADSGADCLILNNIVPDYLIGDFDSINFETLKFLENHNCEIIRYPKEKDYTDTFLAVEKAIQLNASEIVLLGCTGSRIDHFMGNVNILKHCLELNIKASIKDDNNIIFLKNEPFIVRKENYKYFSLVAYKDTVRNLTLDNVKYKLNNYDLEIGDSLTISNEFIAEYANVEFSSGIIQVILSKD